MFHSLAVSRGRQSMTSTLAVSSGTSLLTCSFSTSPCHHAWRKSISSGFSHISATPVFEFSSHHGVVARHFSGTTLSRQGLNGRSEKPYNHEIPTTSQPQPTSSSSQPLEKGHDAGSGTEAWKGATTRATSATTTTAASGSSSLSPKCETDEGNSTDTKSSLSSLAEPSQARATTTTTTATTTPREYIWTIPNILTFSRLFLTPGIGYLVATGSHPGLAFGLLCYAGASDLVDGWIARRWHLQTVVGSVIDPMADKALITVLTVALATQGALPVWLATLILGRDVGLGISALYYRYISLPPPKTMRRYWDFSLPSAEVRPTTVSKWNTALQMGLVGLLTGQPILEPLMGVEMGAALGGLGYVVAITTVWSGASYVFSKDAVRILSQKGKGKAECDSNACTDYGFEIHEGSSSGGKGLLFGFRS